MKLSKKDLALISSGLGLMVEVLKQQNGWDKGVREVTNIQEINDFVSEVNRGDPTTSYEEIEDLMNEIFMFATEALSNSEQDLADLPQNSKYLH